MSRTGGRYRDQLGFTYQTIADGWRAWILSDQTCIVQRCNEAGKWRATVGVDDLDSATAYVHTQLEA